MVNVVIVPFHDYKKWNEEGFRTRDAHVCEHFSENSEIEKILVINRPTSLAEVLAAVSVSRSLARMQRNRKFYRGPSLTLKRYDAQSTILVQSLF